MGTRKYQLRQRAEQQQATRRRITEAAVRLHGSVGPAATTIRAIAELAGVQRATVYRHFPDEAALVRACSAHFFAANPPPDPAAWQQLTDPHARLAQALGELYAWYAHTEPMLANITRDAELLPQLVGRGYAELLDRLRQALTPGWDAEGARARLTQAALAHALGFRTWRSLVREQGLDTAEAVELMTGLVCTAARERSETPS
jgi:AcrR family transcriptional regulator